MKTCPKCGDSKPATQFSKNASKRDGLSSNCKVCAKASIDRWRATNPDKVKAEDAKWRERHRDKCRAKVAKWRAANPDKNRAGNAKWYAVNLDKARSSSAAWKAANPEAVRIGNHNQRARKREAGGTLSRGLAERLYKLQRGKCACGCKQPLGTDFHRDHIMPLALGGTNTDDNMQLLTATCNQQKHAKHPIEFMQQRGFLL